MIEVASTGDEDEEEEEEEEAPRAKKRRGRPRKGAGSRKESSKKAARFSYIDFNPVLANKGKQLLIMIFVISFTEWLWALWT